MTSNSVTIITGYYNRKEHVDESIQSLVNQDYPDIKIIVFDDASTDGTYERLKAFEEKHENLTVVRHSHNLGFVQGLINIIRTITSEFVAIHGSGDISLPQRISKQVKFLTENPDIGVVSSNSLINCDQSSPTSYKRYTKFVETKDLIKQNPIVHGSSMFRLNLYKQSGGYREFFIYGQDRDLWLRMSLITKIFILPDVLYKINTPANTLSRNLEKTVTQILLSTFSTQMIIFRKKHGYDFLDIYGDKAGLYWNSTKAVGKINKLILLQIYQNKEPNVHYLMHVSQSMKPSLGNKFYIGILRTIYFNNFLRKMLENLLQVILKNRYWNNYQLIRGNGQHIQN